MKRLLLLLILGLVAINAHAQVSISTRADSIKAINDRQITTSVPPNLVYPVQVGSKTDSLCALIKSLRDSMVAIAASTNGLQQVTDNLDTTNNNMTVGDGTFYTVHSPIGITTVKKSGNVVESYLGYGSGKNYVYLKDPASSNGFFINSGNLTGLRYGYLPDEGTSGGGIRSSFMLHYTVHPLTIDLAGTGDSTVLQPGSLNVYGPPTFTYNSYGYFTPFALFFGEINTAHTHVDGLHVGFTTDGNSYSQNFQNDTGAIALVHNITSATTLPATQIAVGTGTGILSSPDFTYDGTTEFNVGFSGNSIINAAVGGGIGFEAGDIAGTANFNVININDATGSQRCTFGAVGGGNGTNISTDDINKVVTTTNAIASPTMQIYISGASVTINDGVRGIYYDPPSLVASATITLPARPVEGQEVLMIFGGAIASGSSVVTTLTIAPNSGQTVLSTNGVGAKSGTIITAKYRLANTSWYVH